MKKLFASVISAVLAVSTAFPVCANAAQNYYRKGDSNADDIIDGKDASYVLTLYSKSSVGKYNVSQIEMNYFDVNCDGVIDGKDASEVLSYYSFSSVGGNALPDCYFMTNLLENGKKDALVSAADNLFKQTCSAVFNFSTGARYEIDNKSQYKNLSYFRVKDPKIKTMADVLADFHSIFADNYVTRYSATGDVFDALGGYVSDENGIVYGLGGARGSDVTYQYSKITDIKSMTGNSVTFNVLSHYDSTFLGKEGKVTDVNSDFKLVIQADGALRVTEFTMPY